MSAEGTVIAADGHLDLPEKPDARVKVRDVFGIVRENGKRQFL